VCCLQAGHHIVERRAPLAERKKVVEALKDNVLPPEVLPQRAVLDPVVDQGLLGIGHTTVDQILHPLVNPVLEELTELAHTHVVVMDDLQGRVPEAEDRHEALADLPDFGRNVVPRDAKVKVPVQVEVSLGVLMHQWLAFALLVEEGIEEALDLVRVHRTIQIRRDSRVVDPLSLVVWSTLLVPLDEDGESLLLHIQLPIVVEHPDEVSRHRRLLAKSEVDHGKQRPFALIDGAEEKRLHGALDIGRVEGGRHLPGCGRRILLFDSVRWINHVLFLFSLLHRSRHLKEGHLAQIGNHKDNPCADQGGDRSPYGKGLTWHPDTDEQQDQDREKEEVQQVVQIFYGECQERDRHYDQLYHQSVLHAGNHDSCQQRTQVRRNDSL